VIETVTIRTVFLWNALFAKKNVKAERYSPMADMFSTHILCSFTYLTGPDPHLLQILICCGAWGGIVVKALLY